METPMEKKQRIEHRGEGMEKMPKRIYPQPREIDEDYIKDVIEMLEADIKSFSGATQDNPYMTGVRIALRSVIDALQMGLYK